jgi:hypothetical protein
VIEIITLIKLQKRSRDDNFRIDRYTSIQTYILHIKTKCKLVKNEAGTPGALNFEKWHSVEDAEDPFYNDTKQGALITWACG